MQRPRQRASWLRRRERPRAAAPRRRRRRPYGYAFPRRRRRAARCWATSGLWQRATPMAAPAAAAAAAMAAARAPLRGPPPQSPRHRRPQPSRAAGPAAGAARGAARAAAAAQACGHEARARASPTTSMHPPRERGAPPHRAPVRATARCRARDGVKRRQRTNCNASQSSRPSGSTPTLPTAAAAAHTVLSHGRRVSEHELRGNQPHGRRRAAASGLRHREYSRLPQVGPQPPDNPGCLTGRPVKGITCFTGTESVSRRETTRESRGRLPERAHPYGSAK